MPWFLPMLAAAGKTLGPTLAQGGLQSLLGGKEDEGPSDLEKLQQQMMMRQQKSAMTQQQLAQLQQMLQQGIGRGPGGGGF